MGNVFANAGIEAARIAGDDPEMDVAAGRVKAAVLASLAGHNKSGRYASSVHEANVLGRRGVRDRIVYTDDPNALAIEYGHRWITPEGVLVKWVKGIRIFGRAFDKLKVGG